MPLSWVVVEFDLATLDSGFHLVGWFGEMAREDSSGTGENAFAERATESHMGASTTVPVWDRELKRGIGEPISPYRVSVTARYTDRFDRVSWLTL